MVTVEDWVDQICGVGRFTAEDYFKKQVLTKSSHWSYEKEWRIVDFRYDEIGKDYTDVPVHVRD